MKTREKGENQRVREPGSQGRGCHTRKGYSPMLERTVRTACQPAVERGKTAVPKGLGAVCLSEGTGLHRADTWGTE